MRCGRKGIDCPDCGVFGECHRSACGLPNAEPSTLGTSSSYLVNTTTEKSMDDIKREAVKEFAERLKEKVHNYYPSIDSYCTSRHVILVKDIDELLKEYEE